MNNVKNYIGELVLPTKCQYVKVVAGRTSDGQLILKYKNEQGKIIVNKTKRTYEGSYCNIGFDASPAQLAIILEHCTGLHRNFIYNPETAQLFYKTMGATKKRRWHSGNCAGSDYLVNNEWTNTWDLPNKTYTEDEVL